VPVESLLTVGMPRSRPAYTDRSPTPAGPVTRLLRCAEVEPTVATAGCRYSHSLRLKTMYRTAARTTMISTEAMTPAVVPNPGYGTF
jgi:hypothetical protein